MLPITAAILVAYCGLSGADEIHAENLADSLHSACNQYEINTSERVAAFLANCSVESAGFSRTVENLDYTADRLAHVWPHRFAANAHAGDSGVQLIANELAAHCAHNPAELGNTVYANRMGNGDYHSGDGFKFRGRGFLQTTGREKYETLHEHLGLDCINDPDVLEDITTAAEVAAFDFVAAGCLDHADLDDIDTVIRLVNGQAPCKANQGELRRQRYAHLKIAFAEPPAEEDHA